MSTFLTGDLTLLRERLARTHQTSAALATRLQTVRASSQAIRDATQQTRLQWRAWRVGLRELRALGGDVVLRVCMRCESVCFTPAGAGAVETWTEPPSWIREQFRTAWRRPLLSHGVCPRCRPAFEASLDDATGPPPAAVTSRHAAAVALLDALLEIDAALGLGDDERIAFDDAAPRDEPRAAERRGALDQILRGLSPADQRLLSDALAAMPPTPQPPTPPSAEPPPSEPAGCADGRPVPRFRPPLRRAGP